MDKEKLIIGYDLCDDYSQISCYNSTSQEPDVPLAVKSRIPTVLCRRYADGEWLYGDEAVAADQAGEGILIKGLLQPSDDEYMEVGSDRIKRADLIRLFLTLTIKPMIAGELKQGLLAEEIFLTVTAVSMDLTMANIVKASAGELGIPEKQCAVQSHMLSYEYYALSQPKELWNHDVGLFEYDHEGLRYHHLSISWRTRPVPITSETVDLTAYLNGSEDIEKDAEAMDDRFLEAINQVSAKKNITTFYLVGDGFMTLGETASWMKKSLKQLCALRRHVFVGQNLYARGACYNSFYLMQPDRHPSFQAVNADLLTKEIYIRTIHRRAPQKTLLLSSGLPWYSALGETVVIPDACDQLVIRVRDVVTNVEQKTFLSLSQPAGRPAKTMRLRIQTTFDSEDICRVTAEDTGFGEIYPSSGKRWETTFNLQDIPDPDLPSEEGTVYEATVPVTNAYLDMKLSGVRIGSLEELCWYISENVYALDETFFDDQMLFWMDRITGDHALALALTNYRESGRSLKEMVRLLLNSVDYMNNQEIGLIYNRLSVMEHQNPVEQKKLAADNCYRFGRYMSALKLYHHVAYQMTHAYADEMTRSFKAEVWHNMGLTLIRLFDRSSALDCLMQAYNLSKSREDLRDVICLLYMMEAQDQIMNLVHKEQVPQDVLDEILAECRRVSDETELSEHSRKLLALMADKNESPEYGDFIRDYLTRQRNRFSLP